MTRNFTTLPALGVVSLVLVAACGAPDASRTPQRATDGVPSALATFYDQRIVFEPCASYAMSLADEKLYSDDRTDCARVQVPLDYGDPGGSRGEVALLRVKARGDRIGSLLVNPGGPGGSGMSLAAALGPVWRDSPVGERFDVVGFDPRGVGASTPRVACYTDAEADRNVPPTPYQFDVADEGAAREVARRCTEGSGGAEALTSVGSSNVVKDMDVLRAVLGDEQLSYLGYSYGSELGAMYAQEFGDNLWALVIDGAVHPGRTEAEFRLSQFAAWRATFDEFAATCMAEADCPLGTYPARAVEEFQRLTRPLQARPAPTADRRGLTYSDAMWGTIMSLFQPVQRAQLVEGLTELAAGRGDAMLALRDAAAGRGADGRYGGSASMDANLAIRCMDNPRRTPEDEVELGTRARAAAPFLDPGRPLTQAHYECEGWPAPPSRPSPWLEGPLELSSTLTVSVTRDPGTPHEGGIVMARQLGGSLLTVEGAQHGVALYGGSPCVDAVVSDFLIDPRTPVAETHCSL
ncbi:alpha/beta hydrolase [Pseudonocardia sp. ICBG1293]|uniref:alpha/beta hydrolase n=1 Tax=Pseudonocardia sp. ICBG1293 TaxID=2844382 RepID=UPI001CCC0FB5|nr:alpha/beta hydrolase [Pseudonocardia sp. ICBG1293]